MTNTLQVAILEPYYGGSHALFVDTLCNHSRHHCRVATMPARKWKWRMRGASAWFTMSRTDWMFGESGKPVDVILCNDMMSVSDLRAMLPVGMKDVPIVCYFHENQLSYPIPDERDRDFQYGMTNILSCLASDAAWFNSDYHRRAFLAAADKLLRLMPDYVPENITETILQRSAVLSPPVDTETAANSQTPPKAYRGCREGRPRILWSHRWEYDKNPKPFFDALVCLDQEGADFEVVCLGEQFRTAPPEFAVACEQLKPRLTHAGFVANRGAYCDLVASCDVVVSTAIQENFGISVIEAAMAGCQPVVPNRLAYPEVIPAAFHPQCLFGGDTDLLTHLRGVLTGPLRLSQPQRQSLANELVDRYGIPVAVARLDEGLEKVSGREK